MRILLSALVLALSTLPLTPRLAPAQELERVAVGGSLGVLGGVGVTAALVVARARFQNEYLHEPGDLVHWQSAPMILGPASGVAFGLLGEGALRGSILGSVAGLVVGSATGIGVGWLLSDDPEWLWAGGAIGGGLAMAAGGIVGGVMGWIDEEERQGGSTAPLRLIFTVPL